MTIPSDIIAAARAGMGHWHVPASVSLAQWIVESGSGAHSPGNNPFGMKPREGRNDPCQWLATTEFRNGAYRPCKQPFRTFPTIADAFDAHAKLIATAPVYAAAMAALPNVDRFVTRLSAHYATDPLYAHKLLTLISAHKLTEYDA